MALVVELIPARLFQRQKLDLHVACRRNHNLLRTHKRRTGRIDDAVEDRSLQEYGTLHFQRSEIPNSARGDANFADFALYLRPFASATQHSTEEPVFQVGITAHSFGWAINIGCSEPPSKAIVTSYGASPPVHCTQTWQPSHWVTIFAVNAILSFCEKLCLPNLYSLVTAHVLVMAEVKRPVSAYGLARLTGHHPVSVYQALERLKIKAVVVVGNRKGYDPAVARLLRSKMRKPRAKNG